MSESHIPFVTFNGGEIGGESMARVDLDVYASCAEIMENCWAIVQGALSKVPGSQLVDFTAAHGPAWLLPFVFNVDQTRGLLFTEAEVRIVDGDGVVQMDTGTVAVGNFSDSSTGASSVTTGSTSSTLSCAASGAAIARSTCTTTDTARAAIGFSIERRKVLVRVGTSAGGEQVMADTLFYPGEHVLRLSPGAGTFYLQFTLEDRGNAIVRTLHGVSAGDLVIPSPYSVDDFEDIRYEQIADAFWIYLNGKKRGARARVLERRSNQSWSLRLFRPEDGPFYPSNSTDVTLAPSDLVGAATLAASSDLFVASDVGRLVEINHQGQRLDTTLDALDDVTESIRVTGTEANRTFSYQVSTGLTGTIVVQRSFGNDIDWVDYATVVDFTNFVTINDELDNQIVFYRLKVTAYSSGSASAALSYSLGETTGHAEIVAVGSATSATVEIFDQFGALSTTRNWSMGAWSDGEGWPTAGAIHDSRHNLVRDDLFWASASDDYESFLLGVDDADSISKRVGTGDVNVAQWIEGSNRLLIGTRGAELEVKTTSFDEPTTPTNVNIRSSSARGSVNVQAVRADKRVVFVSRSRRRLHQLLYDIENNSYRSDDLTRLHKRIAGWPDESDIYVDEFDDAEEEADGVGFVQIAYQAEPEPRLWCVRRDGQLAVLLFAPDEGAYSWSRITPSGTNAAFESVCVLPGKKEDRILVVVRREIDGNTHRFVERFAPEQWMRLENAWRVQCGLRYDGPPTTTLTGLSHLKGEQVAIWANGRVHPPKTVAANGTVTLDYEVTKAIVGLNYIGKWKSTKLAYGARMGTALAQNKQVGRMGMVLYETPVGAVGYGRNFDVDEAGQFLHMDYEVGEFEDGYVMDAAVPLRSEEFNQAFEGEKAIDPRVCLVMDKPAPATVSALIPHMKINE